MLARGHVYRGHRFDVSVYPARGGWNGAIVVSGPFTHGEPHVKIVRSYVNAESAASAAREAARRWVDLNDVFAELGPSQ